MDDRGPLRRSGSPATPTSPSRRRRPTTSWPPSRSSCAAAASAGPCASRSTRDVDRRDPRAARCASSTSSDDDVYRAPRARSTSAGCGRVHDLDRPDLKDEPWVAGHARPGWPRADDEPVDFFARAPRRATCSCTTPTTSFATSVEEFIRQAARRPQGARHQDDAVPHLGRQPHRASRSSGRPSGASRWPRSSSSRPASTRQANIEWATRAGGGGRPRRLRPRRPQDPHQDGARRARRGRRASAATATSAPATTTRSTARLYEDIGLLTADPELGADLTPAVQLPHRLRPQRRATASCSWRPTSLRPRLHRAHRGRDRGGRRRRRAASS